MTGEPKAPEGWTEIARTKYRVYDFRDDEGKLSFKLDGLSDLPEGVTRLVLMPDWQEVRVTGVDLVGYDSVTIQISFELLP